MSKDDIEEMDKLVTLLKTGDVTLFVNQQLKDEVARNRETVVQDSYAKLQNTRFQVETPNYCSAMKELAKLREKLKDANTARNELVDVVGALLKEEKLPADVLIQELFEKGTDLEITHDIIQKAQLRVQLGNPPGKRQSIGDAIHWEVLLTQRINGKLFIVSRDADFASEIGPKKLKTFLLDEWQSRNGPASEVQYFASLGAYIKNQFPEIELSTEMLKNDLISQLQNSTNFAATHAVIAEISDFKYFTPGQIKLLFEILVENNQVGWIGTDEDVKEFYTRFQKKSKVVPIDLWGQVAESLDVDEMEFFNPF